MSEYSQLWDDLFPHLYGMSAIYTIQRALRIEQTPISSLLSILGGLVSISHFLLSIRSNGSQDINSCNPYRMRAVMCPIFASNSITGLIICALIFRRRNRGRLSSLCKADCKVALNMRLIKSLGQR